MPFALKNTQLHDICAALAFELENNSSKEGNLDQSASPGNTRKGGRLLGGGLFLFEHALAGKRKKRRYPPSCLNL
eukprot:4349243-Amphidinium_carterae.1